MNKKVNSFKQSVSIRTVCDVKNYNKCSKISLLALTKGPQLFSHSFIALSITCCSKSVQKFAVRVRQVTTVAMATTQLVLNQFKKFYCIN